MPQLYRVFVSHAARDRWIAERIAEALRGRGARPFLDVDDIEKGDNIPEAIRKELNRADELVALFTSPSLTPIVSRTGGSGYSNYSSNLAS